MYVGMACVTEHIFWIAFSFRRNLQIFTHNCRSDGPLDLQIWLQAVPPFMLSACIQWPHLFRLVFLIDSRLIQMRLDLEMNLNLVICIKTQLMQKSKPWLVTLDAIPLPLIIGIWKIRPRILHRIFESVLHLVFKNIQKVLLTMWYASFTWNAL